MKAIRKALAVLVMLLLCIGIISVSAYAATTSQDGLEVTLTTNKGAYSQGENIVATLTVKNTSDVEVANVSLESLIPEGYVLEEGDEATMRLETLKAGETVTLTVTFVAARTDSPDATTPETGDDAMFGLWVGLMVVAVIGLTVLTLKSKLCKKMLALVLCVAMLASMFVGTPARAKDAETNEKTIDVSTTVKVNGEQVEVKAMVRYQIVEDEVPGESEENSYIVTFESNGGSEIEAQTIAEGETATEPEAPVLEAYTFVGWYADAELTTVYDFATPVNSNITLYAAWKAVPSEPDDAVDEEDTEVSEDDKCILTASESEVLANSGTEVVFYVNSTLTVPYFELYLNGENTGVVLYDNGDYSGVGDDIPNDGCYTGTYMIDLDVEEDIIFTAKTAVGETVICTNEVSIFVYYELTNDQMAAMDAVETNLAALIEEARTEVGENAEPNELVAAILLKTGPYLEQLQTTGMISELDYCESAYMYSWVYAETGIEAGYIIYDPFDNDNTMKAESNDEASGSSTTKNISVNASYSKGSAIILNNFPADNSWNVTYDACADALTKAGFDVTRVYSFTVADFKNLQEYNSLILVNSHGNTHNGKKSGRPCICTEEAVSNGKYSSDLKKNRIRRVNGKYWIEPKFFEFYYEDDNLSNPIFYLGICRGYANDKLVSVLDDVGAGAALGYTASVSVAYDNAMVRTLVERLIAGDDVEEAVVYAKQQHGQQDSGIDSEWKMHAVLTLHDNAYDNLYHQLLNGDFDSVWDLTDNGISGWKEYGDARSIYRLSGIKPLTWPKMAIISSGFGSMNDETTSCIYQTILVPEDASTLEFSYDIVSEEPMEYVGSDYDDIFQVDILSTNGDILETLAYESVNTSTWYAVDGINFPGGDDTTYHTRWQTVTSDAISAYRGQLIVLRFTVQDTGDAIYDTAALIDSVSIT